MNRADWVVVLLAIAILPVLYTQFWFSQGSGHQAEIQFGAAESKVVSLGEPRILQIKGSLGESMLEIRDYKIRFLQAPCKGKVCIHSGWLQNVGGILACVPNRITVRILGNDRHFDAINF